MKIVIDTLHFFMKTALRFLPLLAIYIITIIVFTNTELEGDEARYIWYAENLINGFYTESDDPYLRNGPGYPIFLMPFVALGLPYIFPALANAFCLYFAVLYLHQTLTKYVDVRSAFVSSFIFALYPVFFRWIPQLSPEALATLLICGAIYYFSHSYHDNKISTSKIILGGVFLGSLVLTKFLFGLVIFACCFTSLIVLLFKRIPYAIISSGILSIAILCCIPYLIYTYQLTGKTFYWGTNGGEQLYWMTSPYVGEWGNWQSKRRVLNNKLDGMNPNHLTFYQSINDLSNIERNEAFKKKAIEHLKVHPEKYLLHYAANWSRIFFSYPLSFRNQSLLAYCYIVPNIFLLVFMIFSVYVVLIKRRRFPNELLLIWLFFLIYTGGTSLLSAKTRYLLPVIPAIFLWLTFIYSNYISVVLRTEN